MVASGALDIKRFEEGIAIFSRGRGMNVHVKQDTGHINPHASGILQETPSQQTSFQVAQANVRLAKMAYERTTRIAQEKTQEAAQEVENITKEATAESRKAKKAER
jgi:hypothetical protein